MTDEQQETIVNEALRIFCNYLNHWWNSEPINRDEPKDVYTPEKFTITDPDKGLYGETEWKVLDEGSGGFFHTGLMKIDCTDGDEGGGSILYVGLQWTDNDPPEIAWITHIFDLTPTGIYFDGEYRMPPNGELRKP